jgi:glycosyltransferase involved in cell wall biosynthesis
VTASELVVRSEFPLPSTLPSGRGEAVFCLGICFHRHEAIADLALLVDGARRRPAAWGMPRPDVPEALRSGFWGTVVLAPRPPGSVEIAVAARLASGAELRAPLARIEIVEPAPPPVAGRSAAAGQIAVCMGTFEPEPALFRAQVDSLRAQTDTDWLCVIRDDASAPERFAEIAGVVEDDPRFLLSRSDERLGFYRNFERALRLAPAEVALLALCDQDDRWHADKLAALRASLGDAVMVYSDQRLVDTGGRVLRDTLWAGRANNHTNLVSMLVANSITGAATLFRREVAELALPFPDTLALPFHDHWLGLVALYDYTQHRGAFFGAVTHGKPPNPARSWRGAYFRGYLARALLAEELLTRCAGHLTARKRRALRRFIAAERSPAAFAWLALRPLRALWGRNETLASEAELLPGIVWRRLIGVPARAGLRCDSSVPGVLSFQQKRLRRWRARV